MSHDLPFRLGEVVCDVKEREKEKKMRKNVKIFCAVVIIMTIATIICAWRKPAQVQTVQTSSAVAVPTRAPAPVAPETKLTNRVMVEYHAEPVIK